MNSATSKTDPAVYLVAIDGSPSSDHVLEVACGLGAALGGAAELHVVYVIALPPAVGTIMTPSVVASSADMLDGARTLLDRATTYAASRFKGRLLGHVQAGEPAHEILQMAANLRADLLVVGTEGRTGIARVALGSVAERVIRRAGCPVLVVRPKDYHAHNQEDIAPPCADCVAMQKQTGRAKLWCVRHSARHPQGHLHYELPASFAVGSMNFRPS